VANFTLLPDCEHPLRKQAESGEKPASSLPKACSPWLAAGYFGRVFAIRNNTSA
jgi:hypothetical protein